VQHAAIEHNVGVAIFSLEMSKDALVQRLLCSEGLVDAQRLRRGQLRDDDYPKLARAAGLLARPRSGSTIRRRSRRSRCAPKRAASRRSTTSPW